MLTLILHTIVSIGNFLLLLAHGWRGIKAISLVAYSPLANTKFGGGGKARADKNSFPPTPFLICPPERKNLSKISVRIFMEKSSDFVQDRQPICKVCVSRLARGFAPRFGKRIFKQFPKSQSFCSTEGGTAKQQFLTQKRLQI